MSSCSTSGERNHRDELASGRGVFDKQWLHEVYGLCTSQSHFKRTTSA